MIFFVYIARGASGFVLLHYVIWVPYLASAFKTYFTTSLSVLPEGFALILKGNFYSLRGNFTHMDFGNLPLFRICSGIRISKHFFLIISFQPSIACLL